MRAHHAFKSGFCQDQIEADEIEALFHKTMNRQQEMKRGKMYLDDKNRKMSF
jgi:hypothetical protein